MSTDESEVLSKFKYQMQEPDDNFEIEYEIIPAFDKTNFNSEKAEIADNIANIDAMNSELQERIEVLNTDINRLTNHADGLDYAIAVSSGVIAGFIDSFIVGEWNFNDAKIYSNDEINRKVINIAKKQGFTGEDGDLAGAIRHLEDKFRLPGDGTYQTIINPITGKHDKITNCSHHLDDFCHHPTPVGLICCIIVQFTKETIYFDKYTDKFSIPITVNEYGQLQGKNIVTKFFCAIINWCVTVARTMANAEGHWMSDIAGSSGAKNGGAGLPGSIGSLLKELSVLFKDTNFGKELSNNMDKAFRNGIGNKKTQADLGVFNTLFEGNSSKFDFRTEGAIKHELKRQALPIILNEALVRGFYAVRHFINEYKEKRKISRIEWKNVIPFRNRTVIRMMTIASGTFVAFDIGDATIRAAVKTGGAMGSPLFWKNFILRVNFVGVGRFVIAVGTDVGMGVKRQALLKERMQLKNESDILQTAKLFYMQEGMWIEAVDTEKAMDDLCNTAEKSMIYFVDSCNDISQNIENIGEYASKAERNNPGLIDEMKDILTWG